MRKRGITFSGLLALLGISLVLLMTTGILYMHTRQQKAMLSQAQEMSSEQLSAWVSAMDESLERIGNTMYDYLYSSQEVESLQYGSDSVTEYHARSVILDSMERTLRLDDAAQYLWIYIPRDPDPIYLARTGIDTVTPNAQQLRDGVLGLLTSDNLSEEGTHWSYCRIADEPGYMWIIPVANVYCGVWISARHFVEQCADALAVESDLTLLMQDVTCIAATGNMALLEKSHSSSSALRIDVPSRQLGATVCLFLPVQNLLSQMHLQFNYAWFAAGILLAVLLVVLLFMMYLRRPILWLAQDVRDIRADDGVPSVREDYRLRELAVLSRYINETLVKLENLKFTAYETQLRQQQVEQEFLMVRQKTHFYINCLSIIHTLAGDKQYDLIRTMTLDLTDYLRNLDCETATFVRLGDELKLIHSYIRIQELRFGESFRYSEDVPIDLFEALIPPLILQTFIENAVEHARIHETDNLVHLSVGFDLQAGQAGLHVNITDNGPGFSPDEIAAVHEGSGSHRLSQGRGIGMRNAFDRLVLSYQGKARFLIENRPEGGAHIYMWLPILEETEDGDDIL